MVTTKRFPIRPALNPTLYLAQFSSCLLRKLRELELEGFNIIQGQRSWWESIVNAWYPIGPLLSLTWYLPFCRYDNNNNNNRNHARVVTYQAWIEGEYLMFWQNLDIRQRYRHRRMTCYNNTWTLQWKVWKAKHGLFSVGSTHMSSTQIE